MEKMEELFLKLKKRPDLSTAIYETVIIVLAVLSVVFAVYDIYYGLKTWMSVIDFLIWCIFVADYGVRLWKAPKKPAFFLYNIPDLIAILPFFFFLRAFRFARIAKIAKITKITKCFRGFSFLIRILKYCMRIMRTHGIRFVILVTVLVVASGGIAIHYLEGLSIADSLWWAFVTAATVGYGDLSPATNAGRVVAVLLMVTGIGLIGSLTSTITSAFLKTHEKRTVHSEVKEILKQKIDEVENLSDEDVEQLCGMIRVLHDPLQAENVPEIIQE